MTRANRSGKPFVQPPAKQGHAGAGRAGAGVSRRAARTAESELAGVYEAPLEVAPNGARRLKPADDPGPPPETSDVATLRAWLVSLHRALKRGGFIG